MLDRGPLKEIYNVIYASINPEYKVNKYGYAITRSRRIWSTAKQAVAGMTVDGTPLNKFQGSAVNIA
jgi:hypothetical protein